MPTPGEWLPGVQLEVPAATLSSYFRSENNSEAVRAWSGTYDDAALRALINMLRVTVDGGDPPPPVMNPRPGYDFVAGTTVFVWKGGAIDTATKIPQWADVRVVGGLDYGTWFSPDVGSGWAAYGEQITAAQPSDAIGYEFEQPSPVSYDAATLLWQMRVQDHAGMPGARINVDIYTSADADSAQLPSNPILRESRTPMRQLTGVTGPGDTPQDPLLISFTSGQLDPTNGGVHVYPVSSQTGLPDWDTPGWQDGRLSVDASLHFVNTGAPEMTYLVTYPRHRYLYEGVAAPTAEPVTRLYPRDDALGPMGSATRLYPPPRRGRIVGGQS